MTPGVTPLVAGNWKMNGTAASLDEIRDVCAGLDAESTLPHETLLCVPSTLIERAAGVAAESALAIGAEDCHEKESGAHTGDVSAEMIADAGLVPEIARTDENTPLVRTALDARLVAIAEQYGRSALFMGEDMEISGAFGMNIPLKVAGHSDLLLDMPLSEALIIHSATGAALAGMRAMAEIQFGGFAALGMNALVNNASMLRWRWGADVPLVVRIPLGAKTRSGPFHANMIESWFANDPGLVILFPSTPQDAYDLLVEAAALPDPVVYLEHLGMYGLRGGKTGWGDNINQVVDTESVHAHRKGGDGPYKLGKAEVIRGGDAATVVTWGAMVHVCEQGIRDSEVACDLIDLQTLVPWDRDAVVDSVNKTGRCVIVHEAPKTSGFGAEMAASVQERCFYSLEAPIERVTGWDTPFPHSTEWDYMPGPSRIAEAIQRTQEA